MTDLDVFEDEKPSLSLPVIRILGVFKTIVPGLQMWRASVSREMVKLRVPDLRTESTVCDPADVAGRFCVRLEMRLESGTLKEKRSQPFLANPLI